MHCNAAASRLLGGIRPFLVCSMTVFKILVVIPVYEALRSSPSQVFQQEKDGASFPPRAEADSLAYPG